MLKESDPDILNIILNILSDDGESIIQIENFIRYIGLSPKREEIIDVLIKALNDDLIYIAYPNNKLVSDFKMATGQDVEEFWFEMTPRGRSLWKQYQTEELSGDGS